MKMSLNKNISINKYKKFAIFRYEYYLFFFIILLGGILRIYCLGDKSLWWDEFISIQDSEKIDSAIIKHGHPPLFYIILHFFRYLGENEFFLDFHQLFSRARA